MYRHDTFKRKKNLIKKIMPFGRVVEINRTIDKKDMVFTLLANKDGSIQTTWKYRGPDLDSTEKTQLSLITIQMNKLFMGLDSNWILYFEAQRSPSKEYDTDSHFPDPVSKKMDEERQKIFSSGNYYESDFYTTLYWLPKLDTEDKLKDMFIEGKKLNVSTFNEKVESFMVVVEKIFASYVSLHIPIEVLTADETLTYIHSTLSDKNVKIKNPKKPLLCDHFLYDTPLYGGLAPRIGKKHIRVVSPLNYPGSTFFGMLDMLNKFDFSYRWCVRFACMSKKDNFSVLDTVNRQWTSKLQPILTRIINKLSGTPDDPRNDNKNASIKVYESKDALDSVEQDITRYGFYTTCIVITDEDSDEADEKAKIVCNLLNNSGFDAQIETVNALDAWLGCIPGAVAHNERQPIISCGNLVHLMPFSAIWAGPKRNEHLNGPSLIYTRTSGNTPFRLDLHIGDVGNSFVVGPTGSGKTVLLNMIEASFRKYKDAQIFVFDKKASSIALTYGVGGNFYDIGNKNAKISFRPLADIDDPNELAWAQEWLLYFVEQQNMPITPEVKGLIRSSLNSVANRPREQRTITLFVQNLQDNALKAAFYPICLDTMSGEKGEFGDIFDSQDEESLEFSSWQTFEMDYLMKTPSIVGPTLLYLFHKIDKVISKGDRPSLIVLDECWAFFDNEIFCPKIKEWLREVRKCNALIIFATQSPGDIVQSPIFYDVINSCVTRIFLPNPMAIEDKVKPHYETFGLNSREIYTIAMATPKSQYYYNSRIGSRIFSLALEYCPFSLAYLAINKRDSKKAEEIVKEYGKANFNKYWLKYKGLDEEISI
ncbi:conjugal transfer protein TrbE [Anaerovibrio sp.]|uniref:VirB4 family type IV secretion/conjugal transfer ATPase n=1 Tax=Anaerovibrio sp. TaxID=1872532 RepID=UPI00388E77A0